MKKTTLILLGTITFAFTGCHIFYFPNVHNVPTLREKGEFRATLTPSDANAAYAITDNIAIVGGAQFRTSKWTASWSDSMEYNYVNKKNLFELGLGYYKPLGDAAVFEVYGGGGFGKVTFDRDWATKVGGTVIYSQTLGANMTKWYLQPSLGMTNENLDIAFSCRLAGISFPSLDTSNYTVYELNELELLYLTGTTHMFLEPALTIRVGYKYIKVHGQIIYATKLSSDPIGYVPLSINMGVQVTLAPRFRGGN